MKKLLLSLLFALCTTVLNAQSVLGIEFGLPYSTVKQKLEDRFGEDRVIEWDNNSLMIFNIDLGNYTFKSGHFYFQRVDNNYYFNSARFQNNFSLKNVDLAKKHRESLSEVIKMKYGDEKVSSYINDQGFKCYVFGDNPSDDECGLGTISVERAESINGRTYLYVFLDYGPINYVDETADF